MEEPVVTSPILPREIDCPRCQAIFTAYVRDSINLGLDDFTEEEIKRMTTAVCPNCGLRVGAEILRVEGDGWTYR
jgi:DNA-directed RNA polymerase subunit RPC12/RpoP